MSCLGVRNVDVGNTLDGWGLVGTIGIGGFGLDWASTEHVKILLESLSGARELPRVARPIRFGM